MTPTRLFLVVAALVVAGCASAPDGPSSIVTRTSKSTTWATPEALAADAAAADAAAAAARPAPRAPAPRPSTSAPAPQAQPVPADSAASAPDSAAAMRSPRLLLFDFDRAEIRDDYLPLVQAHARRLISDRDLRLVLEGHADERGGAEYNLALGQRRAEAVLRALVAAGAAETQLEAISFGDTRPAVAGHDEAAWSQNRRVEIKDR